MTWLLSPKFWIACAMAGALAFSHFFVYRSGKATVRAQFEAYKVAAEQKRAAAAGATTPEVEAAVADLRTAADALDALNPDTPAPA